MEIVQVLAGVIDLIGVNKSSSEISQVSKLCVKLPDSSCHRGLLQAISSSEGLLLLCLPEKQIQSESVCRS